MKTQGWKIEDDGWLAQSKTWRSTRLPLFGFIILHSSFCGSQCYRLRKQW